MSGSPDYILDIKGLPAGGTGSSGVGAAPAAPARPWLAVHWRCCGVYSRIYRNKDATAYEGKCPRCAKAVRALVGAGGTDNRFFEAG